MTVRHALTLLAVLAATAPASFAAQQCSVRSATALTPLIELYTSEGCSSCPPADRWLRRLRADGLAPQRVTALAFHVDYWDYIGWHDRFASPDFGARQRAAVRRAGGHTVYTPQVMLNGSALSDWRSARLPTQAEAAGASLALSGRPAADGGWDILLEGRSEGPDAPRLTLALVQHGLASSIEAGENRGVRLEHDFVVRAMIERSAESTTFTLRHHFRPASELDFAAAAVVALAHDDNGKLLQSLTLPWCP